MLDRFMAFGFGICLSAIITFMIAVKSMNLMHDKECKKCRKLVETKSHYTTFKGSKQT